MTILQFDNVGLSRLGELVFEERLGQRAFVKKNRRNRHDETQFIRNTLTHKVAAEIMDAEDPALIHSPCISVSSMRMHGLQRMGYAKWVRLQPSQNIVAAPQNRAFSTCVMTYSAQ